MSNLENVLSTLVELKRITVGGVWGQSPQPLRAFL